MSYTDDYLAEKLHDILMQLYPNFSGRFPGSHKSRPTVNTESIKNINYSISTSQEKYRVFSEIEGKSESSGNLDSLEVVTSPQLSSLETSSPVTTTSHAIINYSERAAEIKKNLKELIKVLKLSLTASIKDSGTSGDKAEQSVDRFPPTPHPVWMTSRNIDSSGESSLEFNLTMNDIKSLSSLMDGEGAEVEWRNVVIILLYFLIACIAILGNIIVVQLVIRSKRLNNSLTHCLLANMAVSDLLMATINIPFSVARVIMPNWIFGRVLCKTVPAIQVTSVYVTSFTMMVIALDRYKIIRNPLARRMKNGNLAFLCVSLIWGLAFLLSLPHAIYHTVVHVLTFRVLSRCQAEFPSIEHRKLLTVSTLLFQYIIPLCFTTICYVCVMHKLSNRSSALGSTTHRQNEVQAKRKRKTIKMLVLTVIFFAVTWAPINAYHVLTQFSLIRHSSSAILCCHLIAMSSSCVNPFIYFGLNEIFHREIMKWIRCFRKPPIIHPGIELNGRLVRSDKVQSGGAQLSNNTILQSGNARSPFVQSKLRRKINSTSVLLNFLTNPRPNTIPDFDNVPMEELPTMHFGHVDELLEDKERASCSKTVETHLLSPFDISNGSSYDEEDDGGSSCQVLNVKN